MKNSTALLTSVGVIVVAAAAIPLMNGALIQRHFNESLYEMMHDKRMGDLAKNFQLSVVSFKRGWFHSYAVISLTTRDSKTHKFTHELVQPSKLTISNFPLTYFNGSLRTGVKLKGVVTNLTNSYTVHFAGLADGHHFKAINAEFPKLDLPFEAQATLHVPALSAHMNNKNGQEITTLVNRAPITITRENGDNASLRDIKFTATAGQLGSSNPHFSVALALNKLHGEFNQSQEKLDLNKLNYQYSFSQQQLTQFKNDFTSYKMAKLMLMLMGKHATKDQEVKTKRLGVVAGFDAVKIFASPDSVLSVKGFKFTSKNKEKGTLINPQIKNFKLYFQNLPANPTPLDYFNTLRMEFNGGMPKAMFGGMQVLSGLTVDVNRDGNFSSATNIALTEGNFPNKVTGFNYQAKSHVAENGMVQAGINAKVNSVNTSSGKFSQIKFDLGVNNLDPKQMLQARKSGIDAIGNLIFNESIMPSAKLLQDKLNLINSKLVLESHSSINTPKGPASAKIQVSWPTLSDAKTHTLDQIRMASKLTGNISVPSAYVAAGVADAKVLHPVLPLQVPYAPNAVFDSEHLAMIVKTLKGINQLKVNGNNYEISYVVGFDKVGNVELTLNGKRLSALEAAHVLYALTFYKQADKLLAPLAKNHNATAQYYLALSALAQKDTKAALTYANSAVKDGSSEAEVLQKYLVSKTKAKKA